MCPVAAAAEAEEETVPALLDALAQGLDDGAKPLVVLLRDMLAAVERSLADLERRIPAAVQQDYELPWDSAADVARNGTAGGGRAAGRSGRRHGCFGRARRLAGWAGMCPGNHESAGKRQGGKRRKGNVYLRRILCEVAHAAARTRGVQFGPYKRGLAIRRGTGRAVVATAHKILRIAFAILRDGQPYRDPAVRNNARWLKMHGPPGRQYRQHRRPIPAHRPISSTIAATRPPAS